MQKGKILGLDLGISSVGWCLFEANAEPVSDNQGEVKVFVSEEGEEKVKYHYTPTRIIDLGSFVFSQLEDGKSGKRENVKRREKRGMRRQRRRKARRLEALRNLFLEELKIDFFKDVIDKKIAADKTPFEIKRKGLYEKLTKEELTIALYHYMKWRGFKSNRKSVDENDDDNKKYLSAIKEVNDKLGNRYFTEFVLEEFEKRRKDNKETNNTIHNYAIDPLKKKFYYNLAANRLNYLHEIDALLNKQIEFKVIDNNFKEKFFSIYERQRHYSNGPAVGPYKIDWDKLIGKCRFDNEKRAPKDSYTAKKFVLLSSLNNLSYKLKNSNTYEKIPFNKLDEKTINKLVETFLFKEEVTYSTLFQELKNLKVIKDKKGIMVKSLSLSNKEYKQVRKIAEQKSGSSFEKYNQIVEKEKNKKLFKKTFFKGSSLMVGLASFKQEGEDADMKNAEFYDSIAEVLIRNKDDEDIENSLRKDGPKDIKEETIKQIIDSGVDAKHTIDLSLDLCRKLNNYLVKGCTYDKAMKLLGYDHAGGNEKRLPNLFDGKIPEIDKALNEMGKDLRNPVVRNTLIQMRKIINAIVTKHEKIDDCVIELSRELKKSFKERKDIRDRQTDNQNYNNSLRLEIIENFKKRSDGGNKNKFSNFLEISNRDIQKYKLFKEQNCISPYTNERIKYRELFSNKYQIDHILPYSKSLDDSYGNKVLVESSINSSKSNKLPIEEYKKQILKFLENNKGYPSDKAEKLLMKEIPDGFKAENLVDTSYLSKVARDIVNYFVLEEGKFCRTTSGQITSILRKKWGLSGKTHTFVKRSKNEYVSFENKCYQKNFENDYLFEKIVLNSNDGSVSMYFVSDANDTTFVAQIKRKNSDKPENLSDDDKKLNSAIDDFIKYYETMFKQQFESNINKSINSIVDSISRELISEKDNIDCKDYEKHKENCYLILSYMRIEIQKDIDKKDRSNHLHHALDAAIIGCVTPSLIKKINDAASGDGLEAIDKIIIEQPYKDFKKELLVRVYEHNEDRLLNLLKGFAPYKDTTLEKRDVHTLIPVRQVDHNVKGPISDETIYGLHIIGEKRFATKRISVKKFKKSDKDKLDKIIVDAGEKGGNKAVREAIAQWLQRNDKDEIYPILRKKNNSTFIKTVKVYDGDADKKIKLGGRDDRLVDNSEVIRVDVYEKRNATNKILYFVPIYYYQLWLKKEKNKRKPNIEIEYTMMYGSSGQIKINDEDLSKNYERKCIIPKNSLVEINFNDNKLEPALVYTGGITGCKFEMYSLIGDFVDVKHLPGYSQSDNRLRIPCSKIKSIKVRSISVLGKVS